MKEKEYSKDEIINYILTNKGGKKFNELEENLVHEIVNGRVSENINDTHSEDSTFGQRMADRIARFGGSWAFIISFGVVLAVWIGFNGFILASKAFDPYPFVFLNLILSCLAAVQAPLILMSQNRQTQKDRLTAENDYIVNFKTELMIENLHYKLDEILDIKKEAFELEVVRANQLEIIKQLEELRNRN